MLKEKVRKDVSMDLDRIFFSDVGKRIKAILRGIFYFEAILTILTGIVMELMALYRLLDDGDAEMFLNMLLIPIGVVLAIGILWLFILPFYGIAEIVDTAIINRQEEKVKVAPAPVAVPKRQEGGSASHPKAEDESWACPRCEGELIPDENGELWHCPDCKKKFALRGNFFPRMVEQ